MNGKTMLEKLNLPEDIKKLSHSQCLNLCREIRRVIIRTVMKNGGHLSSNLGTVELSVALHRVFDSPLDKIIFDVGHQSYTHKILTGRLDDFPNLRRENGLSGFSKPRESVHDAFIGGHSSTSVSAAVGTAEAMKLNGDFLHKAVAVIGDGSLTGGLAHEGINNGGKCGNLIVILNHNEMSISKNVGAMAKYLTAVRGNRIYINTKRRVENILSKTPVVGESIYNLMSYSKDALKSLLYHNTTMFENLGYVYLGPVNGHDIQELEDAFTIAKRLDKPVFIHVCTVKGKGFRPAEENPGAFHSVPSGGYRKSNPLNRSEDGFSECFGKELCALARNNSEIIAVTAAMKYGTGLQYFASEFPNRFFDTGIAESHAAVFAAAMAKSGKLPVFAVYSSFMQRAYDQIIHDCAIENLHVVFGVDRAGLVEGDGETHQGIFDIPFIRSVPNTTIYSPSNTEEMKLCLNTAVNCDKGVVCVRYPKGQDMYSELNTDITDDHAFINNGSATVAVSFGRIVSNVLKALESSGNRFDFLKLVKIFPLREDILRFLLKYKRIVFFEESGRSGGIGEYLSAELAARGYQGETELIAVEGFPEQAETREAFRKYCLDAESIERIILRDMYSSGVKYIAT